MQFDAPSGTSRLVLTLLVGLATIGYGAYSYDTQTSELNSAVEVDATIVSTSIEEKAGKGEKHSPQATFDYIYEGETYTSSNVYPGQLPRTFGSEEKASAKLSGYERGDTVTAYVPTDDPDDAFLKHESSNRPFLVMGFGTLMILGALYSRLTE